MVGRYQTWQATLAAPVRFSGVGVHSGRPATAVIHPAAPHHGISFLRRGADGVGGVEIAGSFRAVTASELCTVVGDPASGIATVEHVMAALRGLGIDNAVVEVDGAEMPIMDGSAEDFVRAIDAVGIMPQAAPRRVVKVLEPVRVTRGASTAELLPHDGFRLEIEIDFATPLIGRQAFRGELSRETFRRDLARARTFGFMRDVENLWASGFALGASLDNTIVVGEDSVVNPEGLRYADEFARHKALDAVGDLALAGLPIEGLYRAKRPGHKLNLAMLEALFANESAYAVVEATPRRGEAGHAEIGAARPAVALAPEMS